MAKTKLTPRATQVDKTKQFILEVDEALAVFEEDITSLSESTKEGTYKNFITSYRTAMIPIWGLSRFANVNTILDTITDKQFSELKVMKTTSEYCSEGNRQNSDLRRFHRYHEKKTTCNKFTRCHHMQ